MLIESPASKICRKRERIEKWSANAHYRARTNDWEIDFSDVIADFGRKVLLQDRQACVSVSGTARRLKAAMRMVLAHNTIVGRQNARLKKINPYKNAT